MIDLDRVHTEGHRIATRGGDTLVQAHAAVEARATVRKFRTAAQESQSAKNALSVTIGKIKRVSGDTTELMAEAVGLDQLIAANTAAADEAQVALDALWLTLPNIPAPDVPEGSGEEDNDVSHMFNGRGPLRSGGPDHVDIALAWNQTSPLMDFQRATKVAGPRFVFLRDTLAILERALGNFMLDVHGEHGWQEVSPPTLVNYGAMQGTGQYPKFEDDAYPTADGLHLIPTSEVSLTNLVRDEILDPAMLPMKMTAQTMCYRREAGSAGRDTKGMIRQHQFRKVELVAITTPENSAAMHNEMVAASERVLRRLWLPYRLVTLCAGDLGFAANKTYDLEVWLPSQNAYREIASISNCGDFQARRMKARYKPTPTAKTEFVHTLNGSGVAVGRAMVAILENGLRPDGGVSLPRTLEPYIGSLSIGPTGQFE